MEETWEFAVVIALGFDPGGAGGFGCAIFRSSSAIIETNTLTSVDEVYDWTINCLQDDKPDAVGIDAILHWQTTQSGWRGADEFLRKKYKDVAKSVQPSNSCCGSMAIQGLTLTMRLKKQWSDLMITETHPKVLWNHLTKTNYPKWTADKENHFYRLLETLGIRNIDLKNDHEFDAVISAWAACEAKTKNWPLDLVNISAKNQQSENLFPAGNVHYFWPETA